MITGFIKDAVKSFKQRQTRLQKEREKQIQAIEKMYTHLEAKDKELEAKEKQHAQFSTNAMIKFWILGALVAYFSYIAFKTLDVIYLILAAFVISMVMEAPISFFSNRMPRGLAIGLAYFSVLLFIVIISFIVIPFVVNQLADMIQIGVGKVNQLQELLKTQGLENVIRNYVALPGSVKDYIIETIHTQSLLATLQTNLQENISQIISTGTSYATGLGSFAVKLVTGVFSTITQAMILFLLSVFFSAERENVVQFVSSLGGSRRNHLYVKLQKMYAKLGLRLKGQAIVCLYVGVVMTILLALCSRIFGVHIPNVSTLGVIAGLLNFIPYIGPFIGMIIVFMVTIIAGGWKAAILSLIIYVLVNQSENNVLTPIIMNKTLGVSALLIFICMLLGGLVFGFIGVVLAVPLAVILTMAFDGDHDDE